VAERLAKIRDRLYLEGRSEERRAEVLEGWRRVAERERRAQEILAQEEVVRGGQPSSEFSLRMWLVKPTVCRGADLLAALTI
jgi:hypothetical protein